ncbi:hypothetical protein Ciccas_011735 [Cichlidogyrus casuarinus]|uniref:Uncharacterized protein n=1 Tax=Cichlidogyrus casuarinus TaxID=1844966 RepID=A0ABD2PSK7_9PLAT
MTTTLTHSYNAGSPSVRKSANSEFGNSVTPLEGEASQDLNNKLKSKIRIRRRSDAEASISCRCEKCHQEVAKLLTGTCKYKVFFKLSNYDKCPCENHKQQKAEIRQGIQKLPLCETVRDCIRIDISVQKPEDKSKPLEFKTEEKKYINEGSVKVFCAEELTSCNKWMITFILARMGFREKYEIGKEETTSLNIGQRSDSKLADTLLKEYDFVIIWLYQGLEFLLEFYFK